MLILGIIPVLLSFLTTVVSGKNSCRKCSGTQVLDFAVKVDADEATLFGIESLKECATGGDFTVNFAEPVELVYPCAVGYPQTCRVWRLHLTIWRYCGNGGSVALYKGHACHGWVCVLTDFLNLLCYESVECRGECESDKCG